MQNWEFYLNPPFGQGTEQNNIMRIELSQFTNEFASLAIDLKFRDIIGDPIAADYTNLRYKLVQNVFATSLGFIMTSPDGIVPDEGVFNTYTNGLQGRININIEHGYTIPPGTRTWRMIYNIYGDSADVTDDVIATKTFDLIVVVVQPDTQVAMPHIVKIKHVLGSLVSPVIPITVHYWGESVLTTNSNFILQTTIVPTLATVGTDGSGNAIVTFSGTAENENHHETINLSLDVAHFNTLTPQTINYSFPVSSSLPFGPADTFLKVTVEIVNPILTFYAVKNFNEPVSQDITANITAGFTVTAPAWLTVSPLTGAAGSTTFSIVPNPTSTMVVGVYTGTINVMDGANWLYGVDIIYYLTDFITTPYLNNQAFTLDQKYFMVQTTNPGTYFQMNTSIKVFDFLSNTFKIIDTIDRVVPFQGAAKLNIGLMIHRIMSRFEEVNQSFFQYWPAVVNIDCKEIQFSDDAILNQAISSDILFVAGFSKGITTTAAFLTFNRKHSRVTKNAIGILNILVPINDGLQLVITKGVTVIDTVPLTSSVVKIVSHQFDFSAFDKGDVIVCQLSTPSIEVDGNFTVIAEKRYIVFPENRYSNTLIWEDKFLVQDTLEFTGSSEIKTDREFQSQKLFQNLVEVLDIVHTSKEVKLTINTGWIMQSDVDTIESLLDSKRVWLLDGVKRIALRPLSKTMVNKDTEKELIEFTIEFQINRDYDEETYS